MPLPAEFADAVMATTLALLVALAVDRVWGEPPARWHPVVWMGRYLGWAGDRIAPAPADAQRASAWQTALRGALAWLAGALVVGALAWALSRLVSGGPGWLTGLLLGLMLKPMLAWRMLADEVRAVEQALSAGLQAGRDRLAWLVSRDVNRLDEVQVRESAMETLAENLNDSVVAPVFWFLVAGLPGAAVYRFANTADAMWGYRGERGGRVWTWAGCCAARADDLLSWLPARITAALLWLAAPGGRGALNWSRVRSDAALTPSPNSGWPMAALAHLADVRLSKPGHYVLHPAGRTAQAADVTLALRLGGRAVALMVLTAAAALLLAWFPGWPA
ncbi:adenosylcobinamide-phosphate synthase CbiB [uncultured Hydrogenophaga sp.]|uniref:adenosylcobinamide-phosphate synthase CbiB n=1 Tax=uncultured Hydrogenophaga sp. TaxID=199683 RepID=UPI00265F24F6|nr:adenosylcobinamide-phosphate synthase CbiB [uncultured Hydrogenophaga sp.]